MTLLRCKGCGCAYIRGPRSNNDHCEHCTHAIRTDPANFKSLEQRQVDKGLALAKATLERKRK